MPADPRENESAISVASSSEAYLLEARAHPPAAVPTLPLRVFISYKQKDFEAAEHIGQLLRRLGGANIDGGPLATASQRQVDSSPRQADSLGDLCGSSTAQ